MIGLINLVFFKGSIIGDYIFIDIDLLFFAPIKLFVLSNRCWHMEQALRAGDEAECLSVDLDEVSELKEAQKQILQSNSVNNRVRLFKLPYNNVCVDSFVKDSATPFIHIMNGKVIIF